MGQTKKENNTEGLPQGLIQALKSRNREEILKQIRQGALKEVPAEKKDALFKELISLRNLQILDALAKECPNFTPELFRMDFKNYNNLEFVRSALTRYRKKFDWQDEAVKAQMFDMALELGDAKTLGYFLKQKWMKEKYPKFGGASDEVFALLEKLASAELDADAQVELIYEAAVSAKGAERLKLLKKYGYDLDVKNSSQKTARDLLEKRVRKFSYPKNRAGEMTKSREKQALAYLSQKEVQAQEEKKDNRKKWMIIGGCLLLLAIISYSVGYQYFASISQESEETSADVEEETTEDTTEETTEDTTEETTEDMTEDSTEDTTEDSTEDTTEDSTEDTTEETTEDVTEETTEETTSSSADTETEE